MKEKLSNVKNMVNEAISKSKKLKEGILKADWSRIVGRLHTECQPEYIKDGVLYIIAESPVFIHNLNMKKGEYIIKVNSYFGEDIIDNIVIKSGKLSQLKDNYQKEEEEKGELDRKFGEISENSEFHDDDGLGIIRRVMGIQKMAMEREEYLLSHGCKKCPICGMLYEGDEKYCKVCIDSKKNREYERGTL